MISTTVPFTLPVGYIDENAEVHKEGVIRLATVADELLPLSEADVKENSALLQVFILSRVVMSLGSVRSITPHIIASLVPVDYLYLLRLYAEINANPLRIIEREVKSD